MRPAGFCGLTDIGANLSEVRDGTRQRGSTCESIGWIVLGLIAGFIGSKS